MDLTKKNAKQYALLDADKNDEHINQVFKLYKRPVKLGADGIYMHGFRIVVIDNKGWFSLYDYYNWYKHRDEIIIITKYENFHINLKTRKVCVHKTY